jgi:ATP-dependent helicase/nuclease subunit B
MSVEEAMAINSVPVGYGRAALDALRDAVAAAKRSDPMSPVTVLAPNNVAGIVARRHLAANGGIAGIEVTTLSRLAERIAAPLLAPRRPATRAVLAAAWRRALADDAGLFGEIADHPATVRALAEAHRELRDISDTARRAVATATPVAAELVALHERVVSDLHGDWYDATDMLLTAADHPPTDTQCVLYLPQDLTRAELRFVDAISAASPLTVIAGFTGVVRADRAVERASGVARERRQSIPMGTRLINASDSDDEVRCVVRDLMTTLQTVPAHRVAVLYSNATPYARLLHEHLAAAQITVNGAGIRAVGERAVARTLLEVLALVDGDAPRADLFRTLAGAPTHDFAGERIPVASWERISRAAGVVSGDDWATRLEAYRADRRAEAEQETARPDAKPWLIERLGRDADTSAALQTFVTRLREELHKAAALTTWRELAEWGLGLFGTLFGDETALRRLPQEEQYAAAAVLGTLHGLAGLDGVERAADLQILRDVLESELAATLPRVGRFGDGVLVAPISAAIGLELDVVYIVGLSEDLYPGRLRADGLLPDRAREASGGELPLRLERLNTAHRNLLAAFAAARESVVSFPRGDLRRSTRRLPSRFLLGTLRELADDKQLAATEWDRQRIDAMATAGSFAGELTTASALATEQEWRTRYAAAHGDLDDAVVHEAVAMIRARAGDEFTRYDGNLAGVDGLPNYALDDRAVSPTALETYAECPHGFFVQRLLGVEPLEQPEDIVEISPLDIGNLIHGSVEQLVTEFADELPGTGEPWTAAQHARLVQISVEKAEQFRERGLTGHSRLWERERARIFGDVAWLLADEDTWRAGVEARVVASELPFGIRGHDPIEVPIDGGRVRMRGSADRVDQGADGTLYVTDIKTGGRSRFKDISQDAPLVDGTKLQLPVYAYAARERFGDSETPVVAAYWFVRKERGRITVSLTPAVEQAYSRTLAVLVRSIAVGLFPAKAPEKPDFSWVQCAYCNPDGISHADTRERWDRKRHDPALRELLELIEPDALAAQP